MGNSRAQEQYGVFAYYGDQIYALHNFREKSLFAKGCKQYVKFNLRALTHWKFKRLTQKEASSPVPSTQKDQIRTIYKALFVPYQSNRHLKNLYTSNVAFSTGIISVHNLLQLFFPGNLKRGRKGLK